MTVITNLISRNLKLYFRDRSSVFFSLLGVLIIIGLYALFLGNIMVKDLQNLAGEGARFLTDSWIMAGVLSVTTFTTTMGAFGAMVDDRSKKISRDFSAAPVKRSQLAAGYIISSFVIGVIMTIAAFVLAEIYIVAGGGKLLSIVPLFKV
jgi:multidrug/hemolysin transport system permease protein